MHPTNFVPAKTEATRLNQSCTCITLDRSAVVGKIKQQQGDNANAVLSSEAWSRFFSGVALFMERQDLAQMQAVVQALETAAAHPAYQERVLSWAPATARLDPGPAGAFMGYDFHLGKDGPRLIEINTNAGGAFLNAILARAQRRCCGGATNESWTADFDSAVISLFEREWRAQGGSGRPARIAIVDDQPEQQYLYPEFKLAQQLLLRGGIDTVILSPDELRFEAGALLFGQGERIDLVYNRLVDFGLEATEHAALRSAWLSGSTVITPNPHTHALFADKRNMAVLSDPAFVATLGLNADNVDVLRESIPKTILVTADNAPMLWQERRQWFFKPVAGHGSKGVYRGSKMTRKTFAQILESDYIAQTLVSPSERMVQVDGECEAMKVDVRLYTYCGGLLLAAARLYRGQTTNFRTPGGGFAPLLLMQD